MLNIANVIHSLGAVTGATGAAIYGGGAVPTTARTKKGFYTLTFQAADQYDATQGSCFVQVRGTAALESAVEQTSDLVKTIAFIDNAGAVADTDFDYINFRGPG